MRKTGMFAAAIAALVSVAPTAHTQQREDMKFAAGNDNAFAEDSIRGKEYRDYVLGARAGQRMSVSLSARGTAYFNILPPGSSGEAIYNASMSGNDGSVDLPVSGDYVVRVYLMGGAADGNRRVSYTLSVAIQ